MTLVDAPVTYYFENGSTESKKYNKFHRHLTYEIRYIKGTKQSICNETYSVGYLFKSIGQHK